MRDFLIVFKTLYKNGNVRIVKANGKRKISAEAIVTIVLAPMLLAFCGSVGYAAYSYISDIASLAVLMASMVGMGQIFALLIGLYSVINTLYSNTDRALLNSLPLRPSSVFMAKFALAYIGLLKICALIILPLTFSAGIGFAISGRGMFYAFFALIFPVTLISPLLPLTIITLFSLPISYIGSFLKGHNTLKSVLLLLLYGLIFAGYAALILLSASSGNSESAPDAEPQDGTLMMAQLISGLSTFTYVVYPSKTAIECALGIRGGVNFGITLAITVGLLALVLALSTLFYKRIALQSLESHAEKTTRNISFKQNNLVFSLVKKDFMSLVRDPKMALSSFANVLMGPLITLIFYGGSIGQLVNADGLELLGKLFGLSIVYVFSAAYLCGGNTLSVSAFSREGKTFYLNRSLPIPARQSLAAKLIIAMASSTIANSIISILLVALYKLSAVNVLVYFVVSEMTLAGGSGVNIYSDLRYGSPDWKTKQEFQQSTGGVTRLIPALACVIGPLIGLIIAIPLAATNAALGLSTALVYTLYWIVSAVFAAALLIAGMYLLFVKAGKYLETFGERSVTKRKNSKFKYNPPRGGLINR